MFTPSRIIVLLLLVLIVSISTWSRLRYVDDSDFKPQRVLLEDHPALRKE